MITTWMRIDSYCYYALGSSNEFSELLFSVNEAN